MQWAREYTHILCKFGGNKAIWLYSNFMTRSTGWSVIRYSTVARQNTVASNNIFALAETYSSTVYNRAPHAIMLRASLRSSKVLNRGLVTAKAEHQWHVVQSCCPISSARVKKILSRDLIPQQMLTVLIIYRELSSKSRNQVSMTPHPPFLPDLPAPPRTSPLHLGLLRGPH
jgi:hypothetical protein